MIIYSFSEIGKGQVVENLFPEKMIRDFAESHYFQKFGKKENFLNILFFYFLSDT